MKTNNKQGLTTGHVACIENKDGSRFANGSWVLQSEPHCSDEQARDWAAAFENAKLIRVEENQYHESRIVN